MTPEQSPQLPPGTMLGAYRIDALVGAGGMGQVYRATDTRLRRTVAIKVLSPDLKDRAAFESRLEREARLLASLSHPNIAAIHGLEQTTGVTGLVLEFIDGPTLAERLTHGRVPRREALEIAKQIALALEAAHDKGIVHRDLKPANIKITSGGVVKVLDFGIARIGEDGSGSLVTTAAGTHAGTILGTPGYMSPEQARGLPTDKRADVWAFGCVLFEILTGHGAFAAATAQDSLAKVIERDPDWTALPSDLPASIHRLLTRCLQKEPSNRLHDIADARIEIVEALSAPTATLAPAGASDAPVRHARDGPLQNWRVRLFAGAGVGVALIAGYFVWSNYHAVPAAAATSVVALPAQVLGAQELSYLTDAIPSTLSTELGQIQGLDTKVPPTSLEFETIHRNLGTVADLYRVATCIVSSITATDPNHFVLNVQIVEPRSGRIRFAQQFEGLRGNYLELAHRAADWIRQKLAPASSLVPTGAGQTTSSEAELALREGTYFLNAFNNRHEPGHFDLARAAFERALALDPKLADAPGKMALLYRMRWEASQATATDTIADIERLARQALGITPRCSVAWTALLWGELLRPSPDRRKMLDFGLKAVSSNSQDAFAHTSLGASLQWTSTDLSLQGFHESRRLDPLYIYAYFNASLSLRLLGRPAEALAIADEGLRIEPTLPFGLSQRASSLRDVGRKDDEVALMKQWPNAFSEPLAQYILAAEQGETAKADTPLSVVVKLVSGADTRSGARRSVNTTLIPYLAEHGKPELAMQLLSRATELGDVPAYDHLMLDPRLRSIRTDARFKAVAAQSRARFDEVRVVLDEARTRGELPAYLDAALTRLLSALPIAR